MLVSSACSFISFLNSSLLLMRSYSLILASSSLTSVAVLYSNRSSFCSRSSFLRCLFSFSRRVFFCRSASSGEVSLRFILFNQFKSSTLGCILDGMKSEAFLALKHRGVFTQVLRTFTSCKLLTTPFSQS